MMIVDRKEGEALVFGKDGEIVLEVVKLATGHVGLRVRAPEGTPVYRKEVFDQLRENLPVPVAREAPRGQPQQENPS